MEEEKKQLLQEDYVGDNEAELQYNQRKTASQTLASKHVWLLAFSLLYGFAATTALLVIYFTRPAQSSRPYSPITHLIEPEVQAVYPKEHSIYSKEPSDELDKAWGELVQPMLISASETEVAMTNENPSDRLELVEGGYLASLGVFHELHCLRRLYWHMFEDRYFVNYTQANIDYEKGHARHCIETLRMSLMCQANTALYTFEWDENNTHAKQVLTSKGERQCVKWDPVHEWASERFVGLNPKFWRPGAKPKSSE